MKIIKLTKGYETKVDDEDYEFLSQWKWKVHQSNVKVYAVRNSKDSIWRMHRKIMNVPNDMVIDHINGDSLDNRRCNLRICTRLQNQSNLERKRIGGLTSKYRGVYKLGEKWCARLMHNYKNIHIGVFGNEKEAALARDKKAIELNGNFAYLNFPEEVQGHIQSSQNHQSLSLGTLQPLGTGQLNVP